MLSWEDMAAARGGGFEPLGQQGAHSSCNQPPTQVPYPADTRPIKSTILSCCKMYCCQGHRGLRFQHLAAHLLMADRDADGSQYDQGRKWANFGRIQAEKGGWRRKFADRGGQGAEQGQIRVSCGFGHVSGEACRMLGCSHSQLVAGGSSMWVKPLEPKQGQSKAQEGHIQGFLRFLPWAGVLQGRTGPKSWFPVAFVRAA